MEGQSKNLLRGECNEAAGVGLMVVELCRMRPRAGIARESQNFCFQLDMAKKKKKRIKFDAKILNHLVLRKIEVRRRNPFFRGGDEPLKFNTSLLKVMTDHVDGRRWVEWEDGDLRMSHLEVREEAITGERRTWNRHLSHEVHS